MSAKLRRAVGDARDRLHGRLSARRAVAGAAMASVPAAGLAIVAWAGGPGWLAPLAVAAGAVAGATWGALTRVTMAEAAVALDRVTGAGDRVATAWEIDARKEKTELSQRIVADGVAALRQAAFPWTFRRRDALFALAAAAVALFALAAPAGPAVRPRDSQGPRMVSEERDRLARSAAEAAAAAEKAGSREAAEAVKRASDLASQPGGGDSGQASADFAREAARLRAAIAALRATNPDAARALERLADRLDAGAARLADASSAGSATVAKGATPASEAGHGALDNAHRLPDTGTPSISPIVPADPVAFQQATWPAEYDAAVTHYFSEERK
ncbi:MAG: hypothetical protein K8T20_20865 [Planctomycetes bacterium]|nr:hypothetical protein [Planctomycetota bacterium]